MDIEDHESTGRFDRPEIGGRHPVRIDAEVGTARGRKVRPADATHGKRNLPKALLAANSDRRLWKVRYPVSPIADRKDAAVVLDAKVREDVEGPERALRDREAGRAIRANRASCDVADEIERVLGLATKDGRRLVIDHGGVPQAVAADLVAGSDQVPDEIGVLCREFRDPEECRLYAEGLQ